MSFAHGLRPEFRFPNGLYEALLRHISLLTVPYKLSTLLAYLLTSHLKQVFHGNVTTFDFVSYKLQKNCNVNSILASKDSVHFTTVPNLPL